MTLAEAIDVAERNKGNGLPEPLVRTALDVLYEQYKFLTDETECSICGDVPREHSYSTCSTIAAGR